MRDDSKSAFEAVEGGPTASDQGDAQPAAAGPIPSHPTVVALREMFGDAVGHHEVNAGDEHVVFIAAERSLDILRWLKDDPDQHYDLLRDVTAVDYGAGRPIQVVYQLFSIPHKRPLRVKCELPLDALQIDSTVGLWQTANWLEREVYDLFGVEFVGHPDPRRILMPDDYEEGHPLRKDFPLRGRFSRAEQTRRALSRDLRHEYSEEELEAGRIPQLMAETDVDSDAEMDFDADHALGRG